MNAFIEDSDLPLFQQIPLVEEEFDPLIDLSYTKRLEEELAAALEKIQILRRENRRLRRRNVC